MIAFACCIEFTNSDSSKKQLFCITDLPTLRDMLSTDVLLSCAQSTALGEILQLFLTHYMGNI